MCPCPFPTLLYFQRLTIGVNEYANLDLRVQLQFENLKEKKLAALLTTYKR